jgi:hypothetical protein
MAKWKLVSKHEFSPLTFFAAYRINWWAFPFLLAFGILFFALPTRPSDQIYMWFFGGSLTLGAAATLGWPIYRWLSRVRSARVYEEGLRWRQAGPEFEYDWEAVTEVWRYEAELRIKNERSSAATRITDLRVVFDDRRAVCFSHVLTDYDQLAEFLQQAVAERQYGKAWAEMMRDGAAFGKLRLSQDGLRVGSRETSWPGVKRVRMENGHLLISYAKGKEDDISLHEIPNYSVLIALLQKLGKWRG